MYQPTAQGSYPAQRKLYVGITLKSNALRRHIPQRHDGAATASTIEIKTLRFDRLSAVKNAVKMRSNATGKTEKNSCE
jgi:hypothetical protein